MNANLDRVHDHNNTMGNSMLEFQLTECRKRIKHAKIALDEANPWNRPFYEAELALWKRWYGEMLYH